MARRKMARRAEALSQAHNVLQAEVDPLEAEAKDVISDPENVTRAGYEYLVVKVPTAGVSVCGSAQVVLFKVMEELKKLRNQEGLKV